MRSRWNTLDLVWLAIYLAVLGGTAFYMNSARNSVIAEFSSPEAQAEWSHWREEVQQGKTDRGLVKRRVPRSSEPPTLVLLRDHYAVCLVGVLAISSVLYGFAIFFLRGVLAARPARAGPAVDR